MRGEGRTERASDHEANSAGWMETCAFERSRTLICEGSGAGVVSGAGG